MPKQWQLAWSHIVLTEDLYFTCLLFAKKLQELGKKDRFSQQTAQTATSLL